MVRQKNGFECSCPYLPFIDVFHLTGVNIFASVCHVWWPEGIDISSLCWFQYHLFAVFVYIYYIILYNYIFHYILNYIYISIIYIYLLHEAFLVFVHLAPNDLTLGFVTSIGYPQNSKVSSHCHSWLCCLSLHDCWWYKLHTRPGKRLHSELERFTILNG